MSEDCWTIDIEEGLVFPHMGSGGNVVVVLMPPRTAHSTGIMVKPTLVDHSARPATPPGIEIRDLTSFAFPQETVTGIIALGDAEARFFRLGKEEYKITLQAISGGDNGPRVWRFFLEQQPAGSSERRWSEANVAVKAMHEATKTLSYETVAEQATLFLELSGDLARTPEVERWRAKALYNTALSRLALGNMEGSRRARATLIEMGDNRDPEIQEQVSLALFARASDFEATGHFDEALVGYAEVDSRFGALAGSEAVRIVASARLRRKDLLARLGRAQ